MADAPNSTPETGDHISVSIGDNATNVAVGKEIIQNIGFSAVEVEQLIERVRRQDQPTTWDGRTPYLGLAAFQETDAEFFFGRERLVEELLGRVQQARFVCVAGPSGSGKSSLVQAGLIHALRQGKLAGSAKWRDTTLTPRADPIEQLAQAMARLAQNPDAGQYLRERGLTDANALHQQAEALLSADSSQRLIVYVDQFEELFTQTKNEEVRRAFLALLTTAAQHTNGRVIVIFSLRADFVAQCATYPELRELINQQFQLVGALAPEELARAIVLPTLAVGAQIEPALVEQLISDTKGEPGALPLLQFALKDLFDAQAPRKGDVVTLTRKDYLARGGLHQALERHAESVFAQFTETQKQLARQIFTHLIEVSCGAEDTRRTARFAELLTSDTDKEQVATVVQTLAQARLITVDDPSRGQTDEKASLPLSPRATPTLTLAHEKLIEAWPWLRRLVNENREWIALQNTVNQDAQVWENQKRNPSYLYTGARLTIIQEELNSKQITLYSVAQAFIAASQKQHRRNRFVQVGIGVLLVGLLISTLLIQQNALTKQAAAAATIEVRATAEAKARATAVAARTDAERQAAIARSRQLAAQSASELSQNNYEPALLLAIEAGRITDTVEAFGTIRNVIANPWHSRVVFYGHTARVWRTIWSKDDSRILTTSEDKTARIWDAATGKLLVKLANSTRAAWSEDDSRLLTTSTDNAARIWDAATGKLLVTLTGHTGPVTQATWSKDDSRILTTSDDHTARIWNAATGKLLVTLTSVDEATWSKDDSRILTGGEDATANIWDAPTGKLLVTLIGHTAMTLNKDDSRILTTSNDHTARIWDTATGKLLVKLTSVNQATWNNDDSRILTTPNHGIFTNDDDNTARIWDTATGKELITFTGHTDRVWQATWSKDDSHILTASTDKTARIWDATTGKLLVTLTGHTGPVNQATWSNNESRILTASDDHTARIWDATTGKLLVTLAGHTGPVSHATWSKDESRILTISWDKTARIWDSAIGKELVTLTGVHEATWNNHDSRILTTNEDNTVRIWYVHMADLISAACHYVTRNFTWDEWRRSMDIAYRPTCPKAPIPPDAIAGIQQQAIDLARKGDRADAETQLVTLNDWLQVNGQMSTYGINIKTFLETALTPTSTVISTSGKR